MHRRSHVLAQAASLCLGRHTITGLLTTCGRQFEDWSASYRLFAHNRFDPAALFAVPLRTVAEQLAPGAPLVAVLDDTLVPKRGRKVAGSAWRHDPQGPPFAHQIIWAQRALEVCALLPAQPRPPGAARAIPIDLTLQPTLPRCAARATEQQRQQYRQLRQQTALPRLARQRVTALRQALDYAGHRSRQLLLAVDGGYTNKTLLDGLPARTTLIGRIRKDAKLFAPPPPAPLGRGRPRLYGPALETPEQLLHNPAVAWHTVVVYAAGRPRLFQYKTIERCRWARGAGGRDLRLVVGRPLSPTPHYAGRRLFFAHPGYLICSDPEVDIAQILQAYVWRWEIEVGFREQKTQLGLGQPQCRTPVAVERVLQFQAFVHALLLLAAQRGGLTVPPRPKWQTAPARPQRLSLGQIIASLRGELWGKALGLENKTHFATAPPPVIKSPIIPHTLSSAVLYAYQ